MRRLRKGQKCEYKGCDRDAEYIAYSRYLRQVGVYCDWHTTRVTDEDSPEYEVDCPNCGCNFGVN